MKNNYFKTILLILFIMFLALYFSSNAGIIDYQAKHKTSLTEEKIKEFEADINNNKKIDMKKYINNNSNHDNFLSRTTLKVSNSIGEGVKGILDFMFDKMSKAMNE